MSTSTFTLGKSVAYLSYALKSNCDLSEFLSERNLDLFKSVQELHDSIAQDKAKNEITIPTRRCSAKEPFLFKNDNFFIAHVLNESRLRDANYGPLIRHLNDCYSCFQIYSQFFKDFYQGCQEINQRIGGQ